MAKERTTRRLGFEPSAIARGAMRRRVMMEAKSLTVLPIFLGALLSRLLPEEGGHLEVGIFGEDTAGVFFG